MSLPEGLTDLQNLFIRPYVQVPPGVVFPEAAFPCMENAVGTISPPFYPDYDQVPDCLLSITSGTPVGEAIKVGGLYLASGQFTDGTDYNSPTMICTEAGAQPKFTTKGAPTPYSTGLPYPL